MLCPYCGTENPGIHRFCGMCGRELEPEGALVEEPVREPVAARPAAGQSETAKPTPAPPPTPAPAYTGGIFNLGAPAEQKSRNLDYLLEDDEPRSHKGLLLFVVALALVVGLGYLRFRETGIPGFRVSSKPTPSAAPNNPPASASPQPESAPTTTVTASAPSAPDQAQSSITPVGEAAPQATPPSGTPANPPAATSTPTAAAPTNPAPANSAPAPDSGGAQPAASQSADKQDKGSEAAASQAKPATPPAKPADQEAAPPAEEASAPANVPVPPKKAAKPLAAKPDDPVQMGEKYLYGRGVPQSCEKGLRYVKPAAEQSNPKAMITMGALYATGHCLSRDLPTAYRYFALALRKDPENSALKQNTEMVWGQMTPSERQLAIRLTQ